MTRFILGAIIMTMAFTVNAAELELTQDWDKTFPKSEKVDHCKATFQNRFGITLAADVYKPKGATGKLAAIAVSGPFGAVKEQVSGRYAQALAERGFLTIAFDPSFTGESGGTPRNINSPDINTEDFGAAVDYLLSRADVDADKVGICGICGWGGFALNATALKGKTVCLFQTHGGGGMQSLGRDFAALLPESKALAPKAFFGSSIKSSVKALEEFAIERISVQRKET